MGPMKRTLRQAAIALVITLVVLEIGLQLTSAMARPLFGRTVTGRGGTDVITIVCVGDSHTHGAPLAAEDAYPAQLQVVLEKSYPDHEFNVINLGFAGVNSTYVATRLEKQILQIRPHLVMVSAGANNTWNELGIDARGGGGTVSAKIRRILLHVKLIRLAALVRNVRSKERFGPAEAGDGRWQGPDKQEVKEGLKVQLKRRVPQFGGMGLLEDEPLAAGIEYDMEWIVNTTRAYDIPIIWFNYPWRSNPRVLRTIDAMGEKLGIPVVRGNDDFNRAVADGYTHDDLLIWASGAHPRRLMYGYVVESMVPVVAAELKKWHGMDLGEPVAAASAFLERP
jgi:hypothetical protein